MPANPWIGATACSIAGMGLLSYGLYLRHRLQTSQNWAQTMGRITWGSFGKAQGRGAS